ncbi:MAG: 50S ribosomal protein L11 methyltransferase [Desulfobulbaceae bacterium]|jgi:ribosomal protein L11 methyltransferase|nr:50S ribosomal protein L11 methyltransferase [Desulfobulbaceae bacterium]MDY0351125.1 50S ribosomal protein L11 methyltransferase [Desulfobulbaceae bacterium]
MLRPPHTRYGRLAVYYLDRRDVPSVEDPDFIGCWVEDDAAILFFHRPKDDLVNDLCGATGARIIYRADLDYRDWEAGVTIESFATGSLVVRPVWEAAGQAAGPGEIILDPSVIFGSGFHATTRLCLETLERVLTGSDEVIGSVIDLGTGTGLLAIAAAKLGAGHVTAVDINPLACKVARRNVELNSCGSRVDVVQLDAGEALPDLRGYDLVVANLYKGLLLRLFAEPRFWGAKMYMISGFIAAMEGELLAGLPADRLQVLRRGARDMWRLWLLRNRRQEV